MDRKITAGHRHGVVLLVILGVVALFGMAAVSFLLIAGHHRRAALVQARISEFDNPPAQRYKLLEEAMYQVIRGTENPFSVLRHHSLLEDLYGHPPDQLVMAYDPRVNVLVGSLAGMGSGDGQLLAFTALSSFDILNSSFKSAEMPYRFVGRLITAEDGPIASKTTRIIDYDPDTNSFIALPFENVPNGLLVQWFGEPFVTSPGNPIPRVVRLIVNGVPFAGTGVGLNRENYPRCDRSHPDLDDPALGYVGPLPAALLPNPRHWLSPDDPAAPGGANEDYDAVDYQNMLLALQLSEPTDQPYGSVPIPSLHRPELINFWAYRLVQEMIARGLSPEEAWRAMLRPDIYASADQQRTILRVMARASLRPLPFLHPVFASGNPDWAAWLSQSANLQDRSQQQLENLWHQSPFLYGPWDVDNDGDGLCDSVWVDLGIPVRLLPDGRLYKPLFAIHCIDLDGRLNVNAHGSLAQTTQEYYRPPHTKEAPGAGRLFPMAPTQQDPNVTDSLAADAQAYYLYGGRGSGFGPAEINLLPLFDGNRLAYLELLAGKITPPVEGRYGEWHIRFQGQIPQPGQTSFEDLLSANKFVHFPQDYLNFSVPHIFGTPLDYRGYLVWAIDIVGQPLFTAWQGAWGNWRLDHPYQLNLSLKASRGGTFTGLVDSPFSPAELERVLRPFDRDFANLPGRLTILLGSEFIRKRHLVTTDSWDLPVPSLLRFPAPPNVNPEGFLKSNHPVEIVAARLRMNKCPEDQIPAQLRYMLGPELVAGLRLNLSRVFGNGQDDDGNGVVDDYSNEGAGETITYLTPQGPVAVPLDLDNNGTQDASEDPRVALARALYVLAMALTDENVEPSYWEWLGGPGTDRARFWAQWAVNVVDFFDRDSIMTRFEYDPNPFDKDGWNPPENPPGQYVVWGCERPELLITETLAFHDRRTQDLAAFGYAYPREGQPKEEDQGDTIPDLDQLYRPQGSLFVEIYNPWVNHSGSSQMEPTPGEFYPAGGVGVDLKRTAPDGNPVWRLAVTKPTFASGGAALEETRELADPDDDWNNPQFLERVVYFTNHAGPPEETKKAKITFFTSRPEAAVVPPGGYAVIGPGGPPDHFVTYIGFDQSGQQDRRNVRHIVCDPSSQVFAVVNNNDEIPGGIRGPIPVIIDKAINGPNSPARDQRLSVSEPTYGYEQLESKNNVTYNASTGQYDQPIDEPLDAQADPDLWNRVLGRNTTETGFCIVHLQRLADPTRPWDPVLNPYRTVDSLPVDLTSFNGLSNDEDFGAKGSELQGRPLEDGDIMFHTRQRGEANYRPDPTDSSVLTDFNIWKQEPVWKAVKDDNERIGENHVFKRKLFHSLGYLNRMRKRDQEFFPIFGEPWDPSDPSSPVFGREVYRGQPRQPVPWLTWWNRPPASPLELLLVPVVRSSKLLARREVASDDPSRNSQAYYAYYRIVDRDISADEGNDSQRLNPYEPYKGTSRAWWAIPYPHLGNFFESSRQPSQILWGRNPSPPAPELHRILEYVRVASPFVGTEIQGNPLALSGDPVGGPSHRYHPPYHFISEYREPGKININTVFAEKVWQGLWNSPALLRPEEERRQLGGGVDIASGFDPYYDDTRVQVTTFWDSWWQSRRGFPGQGYLWTFDPIFPTVFANPLRSPSGAWLVPLPVLTAAIPREVNSTLLREHPQQLFEDLKMLFAGPPPVPTQFRFRRPLFETKALKPTEDASNPLDPNSPLVPWCDTDRNPFFRYRHLMRLANLVTRRSNVYAVWITVGFFEVARAEQGNIPAWLQALIGQHPSLLDELYPDGWILGPELGSDRGEVRRHRMFFIFDRSIPVGFVRGQNYNVDKAILVRRYIDLD